MTRDKTLEAVTHSLMAIRCELLNMYDDKRNGDVAREQCMRVLRDHIGPALSGVQMMQDADVHRYGSQRRTDMKDELGEMKMEKSNDTYQGVYFGRGQSSIGADVEAEKGAMP